MRCQVLGGAITTFLRIFSRTNVGSFESTLSHVAVGACLLVRDGVRTTASLTTTYGDTNPLLMPPLDLTIVISGRCVAFFNAHQPSISCQTAAYRDDVMRNRRNFSCALTD